MLRLAARYTLLLVACLACVVSNAKTYDVWIGVAEPTAAVEPKGVYHATLDSESGELTPPRLVGEVAGAGFLATHPTRDDVLYSTGTVDGAPAVVAWRIVRDVAPRLERINSQPTGDGGSCHVSVDQTGRVLLSAQYMGGSIVAFPLDDQGAIEPRSDIAEHTGASGVVASRQEAPHPHWTGVSPDNRFALVPDLGQDRIRIYKLDPAAAKLTPYGSAIAPAGGGPRHLAWRPDGRFAYVVDELTCSLSTYGWKADSGELGWIDTQPMVSKAALASEPPSKASEVAIHPSGRFVYAAVRGYDRISVFQSDPQTGILDPVENEPVRGSWPRHFGVSPDGAWLVVAGRDTNTLTVFAIDQETGALRYTLTSVNTPRPICVLLR